MSEPGVRSISLPETKDDHHTLSKILTHFTNVIFRSFSAHCVSFIFLDKIYLIVIEFIISTIFLEKLNLYMER